MDQLRVLEKEIMELRQLLRSKELALLEARAACEKDIGIPTLQKALPINNLPKWAIERYSRQIILPEIGVSGQRRLLNSSVLVVGAGGIGSPAAVYLVGSGVGHVGIVDYDVVDLTNLHRQVIHNEHTIGENKVDSAVQYLRRLNSKVKVTPHHIQLTSSNALTIISNYDIVVDATDNMVTRYLLNDACVLLNKPLVSGSALKMEGQLTVYNYRPKDGNKEQMGPCYRCLFPVPSPPDTVGSCSSAGVSPAVPGVVGCLQALETLKLVLDKPTDELLVGKMLLFDGSDCGFRKVKLRGRNPTCPVCSDNPTITELVDYELFCKTKAVETQTIQLLTPDQRISVEQLSDIMTSKTKDHRLIDVRSAAEFDMCAIPGSYNIPIDNMKERMLKDLVIDLEKSGTQDVIFLCRRGNDSQIAADLLSSYCTEINKKSLNVRDVTGGLHAWAEVIDTRFPVY